MMRRRFAFGIALFAAVSVCVGCVGQRYIKVKIEKDGKTILQSEGGVPDRLTAAQIWQRLDGKVFEAVEKIDADPNNPDQATLTGDIKITIHHVSELMASAKVKTLRLVRVKGKTDEWQIPQDEVKRTATVIAP